MAEVLVFHHIQGLTEGVTGFADELRAAGHTVHTPDLFEGRTFDTIEEGFAFAQSLNSATDERASGAAEAHTIPARSTGREWSTSCHDAASTRRARCSDWFVHQRSFSRSLV